MRFRESGPNERNPERTREPLRAGRCAGSKPQDRSHRTRTEEQPHDDRQRVAAAGVHVRAVRRVGEKQDDREVDAVSSEAAPNKRTATRRETRSLAAKAKSAADSLS